MPRSKNENWYIVLELEFDPPVEDEVAVQRRIDEKKDFWNRNANGLKGKEYSVWRDAIPKIKKEMIGPENIRKQLAKEAEQLTYGQIDDDINTSGMKGNITDSEVVYLANAHNTTEAVIKKRASKLKIPVVKDSDLKSSFDLDSVYKKYCEPIPEPDRTYTLSLPRYLSTFGLVDVYEFLYEKGHQASTAEVLRKKATEKRKEFIYRDQKSSNGNNICGLCETKIFVSEDSKKKYDEFLLSERRQKIFKQIKRVAEPSKRLIQEQFESFVNQLTDLCRDADLAEQIVTAFCVKEEIRYSSNTKNDDKSSQKKCRCGVYNDKTRSVCYKCGLPLEIVCPKCSKTNPSYIAFCDCGFDMNNIDRSDELCNIASNDIRQMNIDAAELHLSQAEDLWKGNPRIQKLKKDLSKYGDAFKKEQKKLSEFLSNREFFAADTIFTGLKKTYGYNDTSVETRIRDAKSEADRFFKLAKAETDKEKARDLCNSALNACKDYPSLQDYIALKFAPEAPIGLGVVCDTSRKQNVISWTAKDKSVDVRYKVIKKLNSSPSNINDGEEVGIVSMCTITDKEINAGEAYFYAVFAERSGTYSKTGLIAREPSINLFEVSSLSVAVGDGSLELLWGTLPNNTVIHLFQCESNGTQREIKSLDYHHNNYVVSGLINGTQYKFKLCLEYLINGKSIKTNGLEISGIPVQPPKPVETMSVQFEKNDSFMITWNHIDNGEVRFYRSSVAPKYKLGDTVSLADVERQMSQLMISKQSRTTDMTSDQNKATFKFDSKEKFYVSAVTVESGAAVFGAVTQAEKVGTVSIEKVKEIEGEVFIYIKAPDKAVAFHVLYSFEKQPTSLNDEMCEKRYIKFKEYSSRGALVLPNAKAKRYYIAVAAEFNDGSLVTNSALINYTFNNVGKQKVRYSIVKKGLFRSYIELSFTTDSGISFIPDIDIVNSKARVPMFYDQRNVLFGIRENGTKIEEMNVGSGSIDIRQDKGSVIVTMPIPRERDLYIKPFIIDPTSKSNTELDKSGGDYKIS